MTSMTVSEVMLKAADVMEKRGWNGKVRVDVTNKEKPDTVCVLGAIALACGIKPFSSVRGWPYLAEIRERLKLTLDPSQLTSSDAWALAHWSNAADGPTVVAALRKAAREKHVM